MSVQFSFVLQVSYMQTFSVLVTFIYNVFSDMLNTSVENWCCHFFRPLKEGQSHVL